MIRILFLAFALAGCSGGCGGNTIESRTPGGESEEISKGRYAMQVAINEVGRLHTALDTRLGPRCESRVTEAQAQLNAGDVDADGYDELVAPCILMGDISVRLVGPGPAPGGALAELEDAADRYEDTRNSDGVEEIAPCVVALVVELEAAAQAIGDYDLGSTAGMIRGALAAFAQGSCMNREFQPPRAEEGE